MNDNARNTFASYGLEILKRSVLLVLYEEHKYGERRRLLRREIGERLGINNVRLIEGILWELYEEFRSTPEIIGGASHREVYRSLRDKFLFLLS